VENPAARAEGETGISAISADALVESLRQLASELHPTRAAITASLDARLEQDFGFDSLGRVELFLRIERQFDVSLPETVMAGAETPRDLLRAMLAASPAHHDHAEVLARVSALRDRRP
jgi:acyl carrier protein